MIEFNTRLRMVVQSMYDQGEVVPVSHLSGGYPVPLEARPILVRLVELVMLSEYTKQDTKEFLMSRHYGMRTFITTPGCSPNRNTSRSRVQYDLTKLKAALGPDFFSVVLEGGDLTRQAEAVDGLVKKVRGRSLLEQYTFPLPSPTGEVTELDEQSTERLIKLTKYFSSAQQTRWSRQFTLEMVNYIAYLESHADDLIGNNQITYDKLKALLTK